jgi:hypothetical protein
VFQGPEPEPGVEHMCIRSYERPAAKPLKLRMLEDALNKLSTEPTPALFWQHKHIAQVGKLGTI